MPFIEQRSREQIRIFGIEKCENVGDLCYVFYDHMIRTWKEEPRWRTAHRLFKDFSEQPEACEYFNYIYEIVANKFELADVVCAAKLAYNEFYRNHVSKYEDLKRQENGDI